MWLIGKMADFVGGIVGYNVFVYACIACDCVNEIVWFISWRLLCLLAKTTLHHFFSFSFFRDRRPFILVWYRMVYPFHYTASLQPSSMQRLCRVLLALRCNLLSRSGMLKVRTWILCTCSHSIWIVSQGSLRVKVDGEEDTAYWEEWLIGIAWIFAINDASGEKK